MNELLDQMRKALEAKLYFLAVVAAMTVPDIAGAVDSPDGRGIQTTYKAWSDTYFISKYAGHFTSADLYQFRCSLLHQGRLALSPDKTPIARLLLSEPGDGVKHKISSTSKITKEKVVLLDANLFVRDMIASATAWIAAVGGTELYKKNIEHAATRRPEGFGMHVMGHPVIC